MPSKKIAIIRQEQTGSDGGAQAAIDLIINALSNHTSVDISLLCRKWNSITDTEKKVIIDPRYFGRKNKQTSFKNAVKKYLQSHSFDLIQSHERLNGCHIFRAGDGVHKIWLQQKKRKANRMQRWWLDASSYHHSLLSEEKSMFESDQLKKVICNSHMIKQEILDNFSIPEEKVVVIYNGVNKEKFKPADQREKACLRKKYHLPTSSFVFLFSGSGFERKNLSDTIRAFSKTNKKCLLLVAGRDKAQKHYEKLAKKLCCDDRVRFLGAIEKERIQEIYQCSDLLVLPTLYDPFPNAILEAWACGLPCITSRYSGAIDIIPSYQCGTVVDIFDIESLAQAMQNYLTIAIYDAASKAALEASKLFSQKKMQEELLSLYQQVMENQ